MSPAPCAVLDPLVTSRVGGGDGLRLVPVPLAPELKLYLADDAIVLRARLEARLGRGLAPYWASAWAGGQALARYILDHPESVAGRRILDVASGSGLVAIAAARSGAATVTANEIDPYALAAIEMNAAANGVTVEGVLGDVLDGDGGDAEIVLAGDVFYNTDLADRMLPFLQRVVARGGHVLVGDPGRGHLPEPWLEEVIGYQISGLGVAEDAEIARVAVLQPAVASAVRRG